MATATAPGGYAPGTADYYRSYLASTAAQAARAQGLDPNTFAMVMLAQIEAESGFDPKAASSAGAKGIAQIVPGDHPEAPPASDPLGQLRWAAHYMAGLVKHYGTYEDALSVYNSGKPWSVGQGIAQTRDYVRKIMQAVGSAVKGTAGSYGIGGTAAGQDAFAGVALGPSTVVSGLLDAASGALKPALAIPRGVAAVLANLLSGSFWFRVGIILAGLIAIGLGVVIMAHSAAP